MGRKKSNVGAAVGRQIIMTKNRFGLKIGDRKTIIGTNKTGTAWVLNGRPALSISKRAKGTAWLFVNEDGGDVRDGHAALADQAEGKGLFKNKASDTSSKSGSESSG